MRFLPLPDEVLGIEKIPEVFRFSTLPKSEDDWETP